MKQKLLTLLLALVVSIAASALNYNQFKVDGIIYEKITGTNNVKVTYDPDKLKNDEYGQRIGNTYSGVITVPETVVYNGTTYTVTEIGEFAFAGGPGLTGVNLPETITTIGIGGFYHIDGLTSIQLPNSIKSIGYYGFRDCNNLTSINFPEGLEIIDGDAFCHDFALTELILPSSLKKIGSYAFSRCTGVKKVVLADSDSPLEKTVNYGYQTIFDQMVVDYAYIGRTCYTDGITFLPISIKTKELDFGDAVSSFSLSNYYPEFIEKLSIPQTCNKLQYSDLQNATDLKHVVIKDGNTPIILETYVKSSSNSNGGTSYEYFPCFANCPLETAYVGRTFQKEYGLDGTQAFYNNKTLKNLIIGSLVSTLPKYGFQRCEGLETIEFPTSLVNIGEACFADCHSLKSVKLPPLLTEIAPRVFDSCFALTDVTFGSRITSIGEMAFYYCGLTDITIPSSVTTIGVSAFSGNKPLTSIKLPEGVQTIETRAFAYCENVTDLLIPASVTHIKRDAFSNLTSLKTIKFNDSSEELYIDTDNLSSGIPPVFSNSIANLETIYFGKTFVSQYKSGNSYITPDYRDVFGTYGSFDCSPIITFGPKISYTSKSLFSNFRNINKVICLGTTTIPWYNSTFLLPSQINVYVPQGYVGQYESHSWSGFSSLQENIKPTKITLNRTSLSIKKGDTFTLIATVIPSNAADANILWESSDENIVKVSESGEIVAVGIGQASVTAYMPNYPTFYATCNVSVTKPDVVSISFDKTSEIVFMGSQEILTVSIDPSDASQEFTVKVSKIDGKEQGLIDYTVDGNIITITGKYPGYVLIEATCKTNTTLKCSAEIAICKLGISRPHIVLGKGKTAVLSPTFYPLLETNPSVIWSSSNQNVATVSADGTVTGVASGVCSITVSLADNPSISEWCEVEVGTLFDRNVVIETLVSTQSSSSIFGYAGLDMYKSLSSNSGRVNPIAIHTDFNATDPMSNIVGDYKTGFEEISHEIPGFIIDREYRAKSPSSANKTLFYPSNVETLLEEKAICGVEILNTSCPDNILNDAPLTATIGIYPGRNINEKLSVTAIFIENNVSNISQQSNSMYYKYTSSDMSTFEWEWMNKYCAGGIWGQQTIPASSMIYDYVARGIYPSFKGKEAGESWSEGSCYNSTISFSLPTNVQNLNNCELIVLLIDAYGRVVNSHSMPYSQFQVLQTQITDFTLNRSSVTLKQGTSETITASVTPSYINNPIFNWTSTNEDVAIVIDGVATAVGVGNATITATTTDGSDISRTCEVSVYPSSIAFNETDISLLENETFQLVANVPQEYLSSASILWSSSNYGVIDVDQTGLITARSKGQAKAILTVWTPSGQISAECNVIVNRIATGITISIDKTSIGVGSYLQLYATLNPTDVYITDINWSSDNEEVATVDSNGKVHGTSQGIATITATTTDGTNLSASCIVTVGVFSESISLSESSKELEVGEMFTLAATILPDNTTTTNIKWTSSDPAVAAVYNGEVHAYSYGTAIITATTTDGTNLSASCLISVVRRVKSITLSENEIVMSAGEYKIITASVNPDNATNKTLSWTSSDSNVARVENGIIVAVADGEATITVTATDGSEVTATCNVIVRTLVSEIILDKTSLELKVGEFANLTATVLPNTATNADVEWTSSDATIASVQNGLVLAHAEGEAIITVSATDGSGVKAECKVSISKDTGIESVTWDDVKVYVSNSTINIDNLPADVLVRIIQTNGYEIFRCESVGERISFQPAGKGVYCVVLGNHSYKVAVL